MGTDSSAQQSKQRGFSLVEAAIVLAVVGLIIGGIWVAASAMYENYKITETANNIFSSAAKTQTLISLADASVIPNGSYLTDTLMKANAFPSNWNYGLIASGVAGYATSTFGEVRAVNNTSHFHFVIYSIPRPVCIKLVREISVIGSKKNAKITYLSVSPPLVYFYTFPISFSSAQSACASQTNVIEVGFYYTRIK